MRYLVTGGAGFVGSHLIDTLVANGHQVVALDDLSTGHWDNLSGALDSGRAALVEGTVLDEGLVERHMDWADACFHLAAVVGVQLVVDHPLGVLADARASEIVMGAATRLGRRLLFTSTSEIYGKVDSPMVNELSDRVLGPPSKSRWSYAITKEFGESLAGAYGRSLDAEMIVARPFNAVGPRQTGTHGMVLPRFVGQARAGAPLTVYGDGAQTRCFTDIRDTVRALVALMNSPVTPGGTFNVGTTSQVSVRSLARKVIDLTGSDSEIRFVPYADAYSDGHEELGADTARFDPDRERDRMGSGIRHRGFDRLRDRSRVQAPACRRAAGPARAPPPRLTGSCFPCGGAGALDRQIPGPRHLGRPGTAIAAARLDDRELAA